jgi:hypothetical protein
MINEISGAELKIIVTNLVAGTITQLDRNVLRRWQRGIRRNSLAGSRRGIIKGSVSSRHKGTCTNGCARLVRFLSAPGPKIALFSPIGVKRQRNLEARVNAVYSAKYTKDLEARVGIEPTYKGFADLSLTTWVPRRSA